MGVWGLTGELYEVQSRIRVENGLEPILSTSNLKE